MKFGMAHLNVHSTNAAAKYALSMNAAVAGLNEAGGVIPLLSKRKDYRLHTSQKVIVPRPGGKGKRNVSQDTATLIRKAWPYLGEMSQQVSQQFGPAARVAPDRWANVACFRIPGAFPVAHVNIHPNAGPSVLYDASKSNHGIVKEYAESMEWLDAILSLYDAMGYATLLTGDLNMVDNDKSPKWSPYRVLQKHGMSFRTHKVDCVAWSHSFLFHDFRVIPAAKVHSDHAALYVSLETKKS